MPAVSLLLRFGPWIAVVILFLLWRGAVKDVEAEIMACNVDELNETIQAQQVTFQAAQDAAEREISNQKELRQQAENARLAVAEAVTGLELQASGQRDRITQLEFEADIDEIPTYADCSIAYIPGRVLYAEDCTAAIPGGDPDYRVCVGAEGLNDLDSAFTNITIGDAHKLWGSDRLALGICNARLAAIEELSYMDE